MEELPVKEIISVAVSIAVVVVKAIWDSIKKKLSEKTRIRVEEIAVIVEALYDGATSTEKLEAFKQLCNSRGLNVNKSVDYLEKYIIPISKQINSYIKKDDTKKDDKEATN